MVRITIKSGTWKNTEDEILKAAVMKYGKNQWARISSLLVRKSAKACKARWYEWLDPSIKKTEWSREEEEKLLHLAKIMPCQWRSIAPMMGRTAAQLLEHYEHLLDAAQQPEAAAAAASGDKSVAAAARLEDPRRLRPGEIDPLPEAKPARPDPVDMDEDEKEMLSEARARLANTKGKKAKRKAREKQLEEARRLTVLQRQRELKAAGIEMKPQKKRKVGIDYMEEIPLEKRAPTGFYSVTEEDQETAARKQAHGFKVHDLQHLEGKSRAATETEERKKDAKRMKLFKETNLPEALLKINAMNDPAQISRRMNMDLPAPSVSESELREIAKATGGNLVQALAGGATPMRGGATPARPGIPARTPLRPDTILREAQNIISLHHTSSSLLGGENTPLVDSDFSGVKPRSSVVATPNVLATPAHTGMGAGATPMRGVAATPMRDGLGINQSTSGSMSAAEAIAAGRSRAEGRRGPSKLGAALSNLPAPQNQFALVLPDMPKQDIDQSLPMEEDAEDALARAHTTASKAKEAAWRMESQVVQRDLPRPSVINAPYQLDDPIEIEIEREMINLVKYDAAKYPVDAAGKKVKASKLPALTKYTESELNAARGLVDAELSALTGNLTPAELKTLLSSLDLSSWSAHTGDAIFLPDKKSFGLKSAAAKEGGDLLLHAYQQQFALTKSNVQAQSKKASKLESNLVILLGGHQSINTKLRNDCNSVYLQLQDALRNQNCFEMLSKLETNAIPMRKSDLHRLLTEQQEKERELQKKFQQLSQKLAEIEGR